MMSQLIGTLQYLILKEEFYIFLIEDRMVCVASKCLVIKFSNKQFRDYSSPIEEWFIVREDDIGPDKCSDIYPVKEQYETV